MSSHPDDATFEYEGFSNPNGTIVPDDVFDVLMPRLADAELRVLLYIIRRTFGFKKNNDDISLRQMVEGIVTRNGRVLDGGTGLSKPTVARGLAGLRKKKIIVATRNRSVERGNEATTYRLRFRGDEDEASDVVADPRENPGRTPLSHERDKGVSQGRDKGLSHQRDTQQISKQTTDQNHSDNQKRIRTKSIVPDQIVSYPLNAEELPPALPSLGPSRRPSSMEPIGTDLQRRFAAIASERYGGDLRRQGRQRKRKPASLTDDEYESLITTIKDYARKNGSTEELKSHITHACDLIEQSRCSYGIFYGACIEAGRRTEERRMKGRLEKPMAYWFTCLKTELGLQAFPDNPHVPH